MDALAQAALKWSEKAPAVYFTPNPVLPDLLARAANRVKEFSRTGTKDAEIAKRRWFLVDFDPVRPAEISANDEEHDLALMAATQAAEYLESLALPRPLVGDSGNGGHVMLPVDLANDADATLLHQAFLSHLAERFNTERVQVDRTSFNAARVWKLYGTLARKGDAIPGRPHRLARILAEPDKRAADTDLLRRLFPPEPPPERASGAPARLNDHTAPKPPTSETRGDYAFLDVVRWFQAHGAYGRPLSSGKHAVDCPWIGEHTTQNRAEHSDTAVWEADGNGLWPQFKCQHAHCTNRGIRDVLALWPDADQYCGEQWEPVAGWDVVALREANEPTLSALHEQAQQLDRAAYDLAAQTRRPTLSTIQPLRIVETDPPTYYPTVNGQVLQVNAAEFLKWDQFKAACVHRLQFMPVLAELQSQRTKNPVPAQAVWEQFLVAPALNHAIREPAPSDAGEAGAAWAAVRLFLRKNRSDYEHPKEAVEQGRLALIDGLYHFRGETLRQWLRLNNLDNLKANDLWTVVRNHGGVPTTVRNGSRTVRCWALTLEAVEKDADVTLLRAVTPVNVTTVEHENGACYAVTPSPSHARAGEDTGVTA
jgi:hypothetical protein